ncbi:DNA polymerase III subunit gamma/tau, partial [Candidatus Woesearchaeota archaeon]
MSYLVFARKYRPQRFEEIIGQEGVVKVLKESLKNKTFGQAFLFAGPRGVGKTSCARILAKALNCKEGPTPTPCNKCTNCIEIKEGRSLDVIEIDGASNRGIEEIRNLREAVKFAPVNSRFKIYIIDEVHMLTLDAFNALLKTLEEPPLHVKFIFATTQPEKLPLTILSRCQRFNFTLLPLKKIVEKLKFICEKENLKIPEEILYTIANAASGSIRDAESILDQIASVSLSSEITYEETMSILGVVEYEILFKIMQSFANKNTQEALKLLGEIVRKGKDLSVFLDSLLDHVRNLLIIKTCGSYFKELIELPQELIEKLRSQSLLFEIDRLLQISDILIEAKENSKILNNTQIPLEIAFIKICKDYTHLPQVPIGESIKEKEVSEKDLVEETRERLRVFLKEKESLPEVSKKESLEEQVKKELSFLKRVDAIVKKFEEESLEEEELTQDKIEKIWPEFLTKLEKSSKFLHLYLEDSQAKLVNSDTIEIVLNGKGNFHKEHLEEKKTKENLERLLKEMLGRKRLHLKFSLASQAQSV